MQMVEFLEPTDKDIIATIQAAIGDPYEGQELPPYKNEVEALIDKYTRPRQFQAGSAE